MTLPTKYPLSITKDYVSDWGLWEAVREIIQNALDCERGHNISYDSGAETLTVTSYGVKLEPKTLLLGCTSKRNCEDTIGSFGEGYKIALLTLLNNNYTVTVNNSDVQWDAVFEHSETYSAEVLTIIETQPSGLLGKDSLDFVIHGVDFDEYQDICKKCLHIQYYHNASEDNIRETTYGNILCDFGGSVYVNGLYVCDTQSKQSYDILPQHLKLDRDRNSVSSWDFDCLKSKMWSEAGITTTIAEDILNDKSDLRNIQYYLGDNDTQKVIDAAIAKYGQAYFVGYEWEAIEARKEGAENVVVVGSDVANLINSSGMYEYEWEGEEKEDPSEVVKRFIDKITDMLYDPESTTADVGEVLEELYGESEGWSN